jgi:hypothetical protein
LKITETRKFIKEIYLGSWFWGLERSSVASIHGRKLKGRWTCVEKTKHEGHLICSKVVRI